MVNLILKIGCEINHQGKKYRIASPVSLEHVLLEEPATGHKFVAKISELTPIDNPAQGTRPDTTDLVLISDKDWQEAKQREEVLAPLANLPNCSIELAQQAGENLALPPVKFIICLSDIVIMIINYWHFYHKNPLEEKIKHGLNLRVNKLFKQFLKNTIHLLNADKCSNENLFNKSRYFL